MNTEEVPIPVLVIIPLAEIPNFECCRLYYEKTKRYPGLYQKKDVRACLNN
jgi:hypothetical protein